VTGVVSIYIPDTQVYLVRTALPLTTLAPMIRRIVHDVDPTLAVTRFSTMQERVDDSMARTRLTMLLLVIGAATALFIGMIGVYAVLAYTSAQRTGEFGIRLALGATPDHIVRLVLSQGIVVVSAGLLIGLAVAVSLSRFLRGVLYEVAPLDASAFLAMSILLLVVAAAACYLPAHRAGRIDPVDALRAE
jgi:ABC-type antimicrobial peptide transport system permease subunit